MPAPRKSLLVALLAASAVGLAACGDDADETTSAPSSTSGAAELSGAPLKLVSVVDAAGAGDFTKAAQLGLDAASKEINDAGGIDGRPIAVEICKATSTPDSAAKCARDAVADKDVLGVAGSFTQGTDGLNPVLEQANMANVGDMRPHLTDRIVDEDGRTVERIEPEEQSRVMSEGNADKLIEMMTNVVREGTGTQAALSGIDVAGKTGTAEIIPAQDLNQPWFIGFAPAKNPKIAVAVTIERSVGGQGGIVAAPIAKQVMESLLRRSP